MTQHINGLVGGPRRIGLQLQADEMQRVEQSVYLFLILTGGEIESVNQFFLRLCGEEEQILPAIERILKVIIGLPRQIAIPEAEKVHLLELSQV